MPFLKLSQLELCTATSEVLPDGRRRITRFVGVANKDRIPPELDLEYATLDEGDGQAEDDWKGLRLTNKKLTDDVPPPGGKDSRPMLQLIYEQIDETEETPVGGTTERVLEDGRKAFELNYVQFSINAFVPGTVGTDTAPNDGSAFLMKVEGPDDGTVRRITRTYVYSGTIETDFQTKNNGALLIQTIKSVKTVPATPSGYTLIGQPVQAPGGLPVYSYTFAKGNGEVSRETEYRLSTDAGTTGMTVVTVAFLSAPGVSSNPITPPGGYSTVKDSHQDADGHRIWTGIYATGTGTVISGKEIKYNGKVVLYSATALNTAPAAPSATIGGTVTLISSETRNDRFHEGVLIYDYRWAEGLGVIDKRNQPRDGGLQLATWTSVGTTYDSGSMQPAGILMLKDMEETDGMEKYTVTCMQNSAGGDPTSGTALTYNPKARFTYPGRAKAFKTDFTAIAPDASTFTAHAYDVFLSAPQTVWVDATVDVTYQSSGSIGSLPHTLWNPDSWATIRAIWESWDVRPRSIVRQHYGYRAVGTSPLTFTASAAISGGGTVNISGVDVSCMGERVYGLSSGSISVDGGPVAPDGNSYIIAEPRIEPAFVGADGTQYYRVTIVTAEIPTQTALPV